MRLLFAAVANTQQTSANPATHELLSEAGPTFRVADQEIPSPVTFIAYGDIRFTDPANGDVTNPQVRQWLVKKVAEEAPAAILLSGDVPFTGGNNNDYLIYRSETQPWRQAHVRVFPALGNHEFRGGSPEDACKLVGGVSGASRPAVVFGATRFEGLYHHLDSDASLLSDSMQRRWLVRQVQELPATVDFLIISLHHPPVADIQTHFEVDHNPRPNEIALRDLLSKLGPQMHARMVVSAGHIHNYERHLVGDVVYLVSGGGGAKSYPVERTPDDLYHSDLFPNFNYVKFTLQGDRLMGTMYRVTDPDASVLTVQPKDPFQVMAKSRSGRAAPLR